jgi:glycosyltransferase involved in cell wall biosynthesis
VELISFLLKNDNFSKKIGAEARKLILSTFSWDRTVNELTELYKEVQSNGNNAN